MPDSAQSRNNLRVEAALRHLEQGFAAFSVWSTTADGTCKCVKGKDCSSPGKHPIPPTGFKAATTDPKALKTMLEAASEPNYGIVVPEGNAIIVIDVDGDDWSARIKELIARFGPLPGTKTTRTPSGGLHLFYRWPEDIPFPEGDDFHGFVCRYPFRGYVVGPGSQINGAMYSEAGSVKDIATLPDAWVMTLPTRPRLIVVDEQPPGYELPTSIPTGKRHDEITRFVASRWNKGLTRDEVETLARKHLLPLMTEAVDEAKFRHDFDDAWDGAEKKWERVGTGSPEATSSLGDGATEIPSNHNGRALIEVGLLDAPMSVPPLAMRKEAFTTSAQLAELMDFWTPRTDAGYEGLLVTTLVYAGALMGHVPNTFYGSREQHANVFAMLVGTTGVSRKGTTNDLVRGVWRQVTDAANRLSVSPNSGEGLIMLAAKAEGEPVLVVEEEFERFLKSKGREGSTLSSILRQAFDDVPLSSATAQRIVRADVHHVSMIAHVTREEITESFSRVDLKNGFANRIAWTGTFQRPGVEVTAHDNALPGSLRDDLRDLLAWTEAIPPPLVGGVTHQIDPAARQMLLDASATYSVGVGLAPFLCRRLDTIAARLALIYACLDHERRIGVLHVEAALAVTDYARDTVRWVFPETTGDKRADLVLRHLQVAGFLNMTEIEALVGKKALDKQEIADLLGLQGYARKSTRPRVDGKPGRPQSGLELTT